MIHLLAAAAAFSMLAFPSEPESLAFTAEQMDSVVSSYQRAHFCSPYAVPYAETDPARPGGAWPANLKADPAGVLSSAGPDGARRMAVKQGLVEMWADDFAQCDLAKQRDTFYDSVWRDAVRLEAILNYRAYFTYSPSGRNGSSASAIDDGIVTQQMMDLLTTNTDKTFGAQNDDVMWWALAFLRAYEYDPSHVAYLKAARAVFERIQHTPEQGVCGGGITWGEGTHYKNAITNALYLRLAARLAGLAPLHSKERRRYLNAATREADWLMNKSGLWVSGGVLADGVHFEGKTCSKVPELTVWTYSQGVAMSGLAQLTLLTGNKRYADRAQALLLRILDGAQKPSIVNEEGLLREPSTSPSAANEDAQTFKGIFAENVGYALPYFAKADKLRYASAMERGKLFLLTNANAVWKAGRLHAGATEFPFDWTDSNFDATDPANMRTTAAAIALFDAAWSVKNLQ